MERKLVSIVIPIYNSGKYLEQCIVSVLNQTYFYMEIILINDGSTDNSADICNQFADKDRRIKVIHQKNGGVSLARNVGIENSQGEYICFIDSDDYIENNMIAYLVSSFENNDVDLAMCGYYINNKKMDNNSNVNRIFNRIETAQIVSGLKYNYRGYLWNKMFKTDIIKNYNLSFSSDYYICEDALFCQKYIKYIDKSVCLSEAKYHYIKHENSAMRQKLNTKRFSVLKAYEEIINICQDYNNKELNLQLRCNYIRHNILILKSMLLNQNVENLYFGQKAYSNLKRNFLIYISNRKISFSHKVLGLGVLILSPLYLYIANKKKV